MNEGFYDIHKLTVSAAAIAVIAYVIYAFAMHERTGPSDIDILAKRNAAIIDQLHEHYGE